MAINPQITKTYASGQLQEMHQLIFRATRLTFCLLLIICLPLIAETPFVLNLWLKEVPDGSVTFLRYLLVILIVQQNNSPLITSVAATGKVKKYELFVSSLMLMIVPIAYIVLRMGGLPWTVFIVYLAIVIMSFVALLLIVLPMIKLSASDYFKHAVQPCAVVLFLSLFVPFGLKLLADNSFVYSLVTIFLTVISTSVLSFFYGIDKEMRSLIISKVRNITAGKI